MKIIILYSNRRFQKKKKIKQSRIYLRDREKKRVEKYEAILSKTTAKDSLVLCVADVTNIRPLYFPYCVLYIELHSILPNRAVITKPKKHTTGFRESVIVENLSKTRRRNNSFFDILLFHSLKKEINSV